MTKRFPAQSFIAVSYLRWDKCSELPTFWLAYDSLLCSVSWSPHPPASLSGCSRPAAAVRPLRLMSALV